MNSSIRKLAGAARPRALGAVIRALAERPARGAPAPPRKFLVKKNLLFIFFPIKKNGWGIMLDDIAAGLYAAAVWFVVIKILQYYNIAL